MNVDEITKHIPAWQKAATIRHEPLSGGYSNRIFKVFVDEKVYAVRINGKQNEFLGLRYEDEIAIIAQAGRCNITPMVLECENKTDFLITDFIDGTIMSVERMSEPAEINRIAQLLKEIHALPYSGKRASTPFSLIRGYLAGIEKLGMDCPPDLGEFLPGLDAIERQRLNDPEYLKHYCHNDPFSHNMIVCRDGTIKIIDWELSGLGDIWYDLATVSFSCGFTAAADEALLISYFGGGDDQKHATLNNLKFVCMIREIGWALLHTALNKNSPHPAADYTCFADSLLDRLKRGLVTLI
jgi:thiamine kinase-like enzyme